MIRVLVADDHAVVRRGVIQILSEEPDLVPVGEASTAREVLQAVQKDDYDVVLLDIAMPGGGGFGPVSERLREMILQDLEMGHITARGAREDYGLVLDDSNQ